MINFVTCTQTSQGLPYFPCVTQFLHTTPLDELAFTSTKRCGLPTAAFAELTGAQRYCVQTIYTEFRPNRLTNVGSTLKKNCSWISLRIFSRNSNFLDVSSNYYTKLYENPENRLISDTRSQSDIRKDSWTDRQT